jgi:hypothetical protein
VRLIGSPGQRNDIASAHELVEGFAPDVTIADKGYDADHLCAKIAESGGQPVCARPSDGQGVFWSIAGWPGPGSGVLDRAFNPVAVTLSEGRQRSTRTCPK